MNLTPYLQPVVDALAIAIVTVLCVVIKQIGNSVAAYAAAHVSSTQLAELKSAAQTAVRFVEQSPVFKNFDGAKKKELAIIDINQYCQAHNIPVTSATVDKVTEEAVQIMNTELGKPFADFMDGTAADLKPFSAAA
jgi:cytidylate kinase